MDLSCGMQQEIEKRLLGLCSALVDHSKAIPLVHPTAPAAGFWFGGGNVIRDPNNPSRLLLSGRYRDTGDSRVGLTVGRRGFELAIFASLDGGRSWEKIKSWSKEDVTYTTGVVTSIEGSALRVVRLKKETEEETVIQVIFSSEKLIDYPTSLKDFQKPGTGIWSMDTFYAPSVEELDPRKNISSLIPPFLEDPARLHVKDPNISIWSSNSDLLLYCTHPFNWGSASTGYFILPSNSLFIDPKDIEKEKTKRESEWDFFPRGPSWDVAAARITSRLEVPKIGFFASLPQRFSLYFYDGAECMLPLPQHEKAVKRARGHSCEELGGLAYGIDHVEEVESKHPPRGLRRLSYLFPAFVSPTGTGCNRYVNVLTLSDGSLFAIWQQSSETKAQVLMGNHLSAEQVASFLA